MIAIGTVELQLLVYAGILIAVLGGTLIISRFENSPRPPRHEKRIVNEVLVGAHVFSLLWSPVAVASILTPPMESIEFAIAIIIAVCVVWPIQVWLWNQLEQQNPLGVLRPNPDRYDVFVHMGREDEYPHQSPIRPSKWDDPDKSQPQDDKPQ